jgi:hypothetical protein
MPKLIKTSAIPHFADYLELIGIDQHMNLAGQTASLA